MVVHDNPHNLQVSQAATAGDDVFVTSGLLWVDARRVIDLESYMDPETSDNLRSIAQPLTDASLAHATR